MDLVAILLVLLGALVPQAVGTQHERTLEPVAIGRFMVFCTEGRPGLYDQVYEMSDGSFLIYHLPYANARNSSNVRQAERCGLAQWCWPEKEKI